MTYLEALEPEADLKNDNPLISGLPSGAKVSSHLGAYANILNTYRPAPHYEYHNIEKTGILNQTLEENGKVYTSEEIYEGDVTENKSLVVTTNEERIKEGQNPDKDALWQRDQNEVINKSDTQDYENEPIIKSKKSGKKKKKNKKNSRIEKFVMNPDDEVKSGFIDWLYNFKPIDGSHTAKLVKKKKKKSKKISKVEAEIERSVQRGEDIVSENLALLYEKQKHYSLAIEMFQKLNLKYPEKSSYFAAKISELNSKIKND